jgi:hypothetical protein
MALVSCCRLLQFGAALRRGIFSSVNTSGAADSFFRSVLRSRYLPVGEAKKLIESEEAKGKAWDGWPADAVSSV